MIDLLLLGCVLGLVGLPLWKMFDALLGVAEKRRGE
jgi:hypothetical protein